MQIASFLAHYQLVYINFDLSSFFLISCNAKGHLLEANWALIEVLLSIFFFLKYDLILQNRVISENKTIASLLIISTLSTNIYMSVKIKF